MGNVYFELTEAFNAERPIAVLGSGQAVVYHHLAIMSKDGDWILEETPEACRRVLEVLAERGARYRPGAWLAIRRAPFRFSKRSGVRRSAVCHWPMRTRGWLPWHGSFFRRDRWRTTMTMLSEDDLSLAGMSREELDAAWDLWFDLAQSTNDDDPPYNHGVLVGIERREAAPPPPPSPRR